MPFAHLHRIDADRNMARFYWVDVTPTLFGEVSVLRCWGRIGTQGRSVIETCETILEAERRAARTVRTKLRRGYTPAE